MNGSGEGLSPMFQRHSLMSNLKVCIEVDVKVKVEVECQCHSLMPNVKSDILRSSRVIC